MSLYINNNMMAANAARNLSNIYGQLSTSVQRLSSGLRINSAADDAAGLAVRELMRADIAVIEQGVRNASDAISMIQTAEGAMSVIDEKLIRMKELAEQASTGTYTTAQRAIMNSEYQAMAAEIDRIANATDFNGVKLLDGSLEDQHSGSGLKVHFGTGNDAAEDYYFVSIGDMRATMATGLQVGSTTSEPNTFRTNSINAATTDAILASGGIFGIQTSTDGTTWTNYGYVNVDGTTDTLDTLVGRINAGNAATNTVSVTDADLSGLHGETLTVNGHTFTFSSATSSHTYNTIGIQGLGSAASIAAKTAYAINLAMGYDTLDVAASFVSGSTTITLTDMDFGDNTATLATSTTSLSLGGATFSGGGTATGITASAVADSDGSGYELQIQSNDGSFIRLLQPDGTVLTASTATGGGEPTDTTTADAWALPYASGDNYVPFWAKGDDPEEWFSMVNNATWDGADILTQSAAQAALGQIDAAINTKDTARANLGAIQNRLENTITNLEIQAENLQSAESRISDVDVATEMTEFTSNNILAQAATAMLAQANSLPQLALQLLG